MAKTRTNFIVPMLVAILGVASVYVLSAVVLPALTKVESAVNVPTVEWLPPTASNISFARNYNNRYFEFDISEGNFVEWAKSYSLNEIATPMQIPRYTQLLESDATTLDMNNDPRYTAVVSDGLADSRTAKSGRGYIIAFDRNQNRGYFKSASR